MTRVRVGLARFGLIVALLLVAVLLAGHDATWSMVIAFAVGLGAFVLVRRVGAGTSNRSRTLLAFVICLLVLAGATAVVRTGWVDLVGREATATVSDVDSYCTGRNSCDRHEQYALRLDDGGTVPGDIRGYRPGSYEVGDRVTVRYDPLGLVRAPVTARHSSTLDLVGGGAAALVGLALLAGSIAVGMRRWRAPEPAAVPDGAPTAAAVPDTAVPDYRSNL